MTRRLEELEVKKIREVQAVAETPVQPRALQYTQPGQAYQQASNLKQAIVNLSKVVGDFFGDQKSINTQLSQRIDSVENTLNKMMDGMQNDLSQKIDNLQYSLSRLTNPNTVQEKRRFPSQPHQNPKGIHEVEAHEGESSQVRGVKALITLRSGKEVELPTPKPHVKEEEEEETKKMEEIKGKKKGSSERKEDHDSTVNENPEKIVIKGDVMKKHIPPPFPQALHGKKRIRNASETLEDLCTIKRGLNVNKKAFLTEQVSAIIQCKFPVKYKDLGCLTILVMIGGTVVEKALLDLGASVNLLPCSIYKQLGLGSPDRGAHHVSSWGIRMELVRIAMRAPCHQGEGSLHHAHEDSPPCDVPSSPDISHPEFCPGDVPPSPDISYPVDISRWERRAFQLPRSDISGSAESAYPENFTAILHSAAMFS
uniref:Uncharacterized protein n=1 Tax=Vitis vinifera TaxID=29760 RepID=A5B5C4_VITVI|nr:hypothetical protein VITISV_007125 [Vitis vinifera]